MGRFAGIRRVGVDIGEARFWPLPTRCCRLFSTREAGFSLLHFELGTYFDQVGGYAVGPAICDLDRLADCIFFAMKRPEFILDIIALFALREPYNRTRAVIRKTSPLFFVHGWDQKLSPLMIKMGLGLLSQLSRSGSGVRR
ncbi:MAG: hypothetical protein IPN48_05010 [Sphingomonadales bacterium]|nr:hypothetical protein [Sphingomonadales bacterium]